MAESIAFPQKFYQNNVEGSLRLFDVISRHNVKKLIFSSTAAVYGLPEVSPISEQTSVAPINPYGRTKLAVEFSVEDLMSQTGGQWAILRYFNAAGADPEGEIGEAHDPETHLIPLVIEAILGERSKWTVFGTDYDTVDGTCVRDYVHVSDLASAHVLALRHLERGGRSGVFNLGNGSGFSVREIIQAAQRVTRRAVPVELGPRRVGDPATLVASSRRAREILNWTPAHGSIEEMIETAWRWRQVRDGVLGRGAVLSV